MPSYYPSQGSHVSHHHHHQPVVYTSSHHSHGVPYTGSQQYYSQPTYGGDNVVYVPTHSSSHGHSHRSHHYSVAPTTYATEDGHRHHRRSRHRSRPAYTDTRHLTFGERIRRFFGFGPKHQHYKHKSRNSSWGFLGRSRRRRYMDARTGAEVDRHGRPVYRV
ncbi:hypothetical protein EV361DRAFT_230641 [Lentinula raphanica]|uniref:Uncharacterized protein n=1 Tax=Lentinula raphanica TaxID=153919 RepID=A0AA38P4M9_9AGAR|nr:hypothetical protein F5880DRAFT_363932 [Lentinula raphanica]KAJ3836031.1 hypothetical protein F5878DRAFT_284023 [Lentinula raphanica]KAJ3971276.1 hypothetical protein EV361DRAFT_230641 [Lentinula raphanica]